MPAIIQLKNPHRDCVQAAAARGRATSESGAKAFATNLQQKVAPEIGGSDSVRGLPQQGGARWQHTG